MQKNRLCRLLNIEFPILQGGMAWVATGELAAAVSQSGGLGIIGAGHASADLIEKEINKVQNLTDKPFGVNIMLLSAYAEDIIQLVLDKDVPIVTTGAGNPGKYMEAFKEKGVKVIPVVASVALAKRLEKQGVDAIIAEGMESGGHIGDIATMVLIPQVVQAVKVPVIAAGGIADGRGMAAALALGAEAVQIGTRFICARECTAHQNYKEMVAKSKDRDTVVTGRSTGHPVRILKNKLFRLIEKLETENAPKEEIEKMGVGRLRAAAKEGDIVMGSVMAGQSAALVEKIEPAGDIVRQVMAQACEIMKNLNQVSKSCLGEKK
ncbi:enoyl-[acyl-carrier-protein] reductase FabK [Candidatus Contubernalis alkaliaceticus]|uniref:enoyl-[acyl-carrier-protein] reductase FabK n=1 Tax=Candidatus Contubernalis alkaliaceticus TaxID=338645 RepID=UPI001F4C1A9B|nr:enoyl-[acyl-carrier-protein] reductase FabK [Candidatus Contubernalis alkalaceticus]UNC92757.1 enoyl-[acyl-carrier-protein] reductase FabK [Candidatus Contubernalis alkalaceticus]